MSAPWSERLRGTVSAPRDQSSTTCIRVSLLSRVSFAAGRDNRETGQLRCEVLHDGELVPRELELWRERPEPMNPPRRVQGLVHQLEEALDSRIKEVVVGIQTFPRSRP